MTVVISLRKWGYLPYWGFCLVVLLHFAGACKEKKSASSLHLPKRNQIESPFSNASSSNQIENDGSNIAQPALSSLKQPATNALDSEKKETQTSLIDSLNTMVQEEKQYREAFSQKLSQITDINTRDKVIASCRKERNQRIEALNALLEKVADPNKKQQLIAEFNGVVAMCVERNDLNEKYAGWSEEKARRIGDIMEKYSGYAIESKRQQIRDRVKKLFISTHNQDAQCAICHKTESVGLLPCGDYVHADCLVEAMIFVWRKGHEFVYTCPGSCGNYLVFHYFLMDDAYAEKYLNPDKQEEIFFKPRG
ncbi:hypothetical protein [Cardinium endosymbiont of Philonthus spinipes]|uniref:hypothetical protein n=1 Tax=Cardinium endosymbiont of Philonthus spinipes TaxID=3077941 RepID=UPI00313E5599